MVNEEINTKIHKLYDRKNEIKLCVRDFFFFLLALRHYSRQPIGAEQQLRPRQAATDTLIF